jgi:hypothetical protein
VRKVLSISDKLSKQELAIEIEGEVYPVDDSVEAVLRFEELAEGGGTKALLTAIEGALGSEAFEKIGVKKLSIPNMIVLTTALMATMQGISYEEAAARFQRQ